MVTHYPGRRDDPNTTNVRRVDLHAGSGEETEVSILHVSMASNDGLSYLPAVTDLSINGRQAMDDTLGQSDHECMAFRGQHAPESSWRSREQF